MNKNQWEGIASKTKKLQSLRNETINKKLISVIKKYQPKGKNAFDYGCGWGEFANILVEKGFDVLAFDDSDSMVINAKEKFKKPNFLTKKEFYKKLPNLKNKFDLVVSNLVLCILNQADQKILIDNINKLLKPDGVVVISFCHPADYITESVLSRRIRPYEHNPKYDKEFKYRKIIHENRIKFDDYHRPLEYYTNFFVDNGWEILDIAESDVLKTEFYPDFIIFVLKRN
ncbi:MAG TPA: class I SAM-dependent methyltransferase [bacterium]|nr:class I SAM-dependent methyltransferase [bacterium]HPN81328.1 class I SAM-dependent methyltransferase [bacterium]